MRRAPRDTYTTNLMLDYDAGSVEEYRGMFLSSFGQPTPRPLIGADIKHLLTSDGRLQCKTILGPSWACDESENTEEVCMVVKDPASGTWDLVLPDCRQFGSDELFDRSYCIQAWSFRRDRTPSRPLPFYTVRDRTRVYELIPPNFMTNGTMMVIITDPPPMARVVLRLLGLEGGSIQTHRR